MARRKKIEAVPVVLHPGLFPLVFYEDSVRRLMRLWRDGRIRPQMARPLVATTLEILAQMGLEEDELRRWALWLCDPRSSDMHRLEITCPAEAFKTLSNEGHRGLRPDCEMVAAFVAEFD